MTLSSSLASFSLPELFRFIEEGKKSGRLIVQPQLDNVRSTSQGVASSKLKSIYYVWFQDGYLVAITDRLNCRSLIEFVENRGWLSTLVTSKLRVLCPPEMPMGVYLHKQKLLSKEKLSLVFQIQLHQVYELFKLHQGLYRFDELEELESRLLTIPWLEMTGHRMRATQVSLYGLRLISSWGDFAEHLPDPYFALQRLSNSPVLKLTPLEQEVWQLANGKNSLKEMAVTTKRSLQEVRVIAFYLIMVGLVEGVFLVPR